MYSRFSGFCVRDRGGRKREGKEKGGKGERRERRRESERRREGKEKGGKGEGRSKGEGRERRVRKSGVQFCVWMDRFPRDVLLLIFLRFCPHDIPSLVRVCHSFRRALLFAIPNFLKLPVGFSAGLLVIDSFRGLRWDDLFACARSHRKSKKEFEAQAAKAIQRRAKKGLPPPIFSRYNNGSLFVTVKPVQRVWVFFRLGSLYEVSFADKGSLPRSWKSVLKSHRIKLIGECNQFRLFDRVDNLFISVKRGFV